MAKKPDPMKHPMVGCFHPKVREHPAFPEFVRFCVEQNIVQQEMLMTAWNLFAVGFVCGVSAIEEKYRKAANEITRLKEGKFTEEEFQNLCHNFSPDDECRFKKGCEEYQRKLFGKERNETRS